MLGNYNYFFFAFHLLDVAVGVDALRIILEAITYNGKQLMLTVFLLTIVVYIYTVVAFNFFRKFYVFEEEGEEADQKCHDMFTVSILNIFNVLLNSILLKQIKIRLLNVLTFTSLLHSNS